QHGAGCRTTPRQCMGLTIAHARVHARYERTRAAHNLAAWSACSIDASTAVELLRFRSVTRGAERPMTSMYRLFRNKQNTCGPAIRTGPCVAAHGNNAQGDRQQPRGVV